MAIGFRVLGPLQVVRDGVHVPVPAAKQRVILAALLLRPNSVVSIDTLIDLLWQDRAPKAARTSVYNFVLRLRQLLDGAEPAGIRTEGSGYVLDVAEAALDLGRFTALDLRGREAAEAGAWHAAARDLKAALGLWRGDALADVPTAGWQVDEITRLHELRWQAAEGWIDAELRLGRHGEVVAELQSLTLAHPLRERFHEQLMLALYRSGRQAEALAAYRRVRAILVRDLGIEPSASLRRLNEAVLEGVAAPGQRAASGLAGSGPGPAEGSAGRAVGLDVRVGGARYQLPADSRLFTGRTAELDYLLALGREAAAAGADGGAVPIAAIDGMAGAGKTAVAVHAAHVLRPEFPDGQLFIELHGHTPGVAPVTTGEALDRLLRSLGVPPQSIPEGLDERAAYYRDRLSGTRTLIILDNAAATAQIRALVPGASGCLVLITSRRRLIGLDDAHSLSLEALSGAEAVTLLGKVAGADRVYAGDPAVAELVAQCGHLPLAVRIIGARLRHRRSLSVESLVAQLRDEHSRLTHLEDEDRSLTAVFETSYRALPEPERRMFRHLGRVPAEDFDAYAAANLLDIDVPDAERLLDSLLDHNLLIQHTPARYRFHDLVSLYAGGLSADAADAAEDDHDAALTRLLDYYRHRADQADRHVLRRRAAGRPAIAPPRAAAAEFADRDESLAWMRTERGNLLAVARAALKAQPRRAIGLSTAMAAFLRLDGHLRESLALHEAVAAAAARSGDRDGEAGALRELADVTRVGGNLTAAIGFGERALAIHRDLGDRAAEAAARFKLGRSHVMRGDLSLGGEQYARSLELYRDLEDRRGQADALYGLGRVRFAVGSFPAAEELFGQALAIYRDFGDRLPEANALEGLARIKRLTGAFPRAIEFGEQALGIYRDLESRLGQSNALESLGRVHTEIGDYDRAAETFERCLPLCRDFGNRLGEAYALEGFGRVRLAAGDLAGAAELFEAALPLFRALGEPLGEANALMGLGRARHAAGDLDAAAELFGRSMSGFLESADPHGQAEVLIELGALEAETAGPRSALPMFSRAVDAFREVGSPLQEARAREGAARCLARLGDRAAASAELEEAVRIYRRVGAPQTGAAEALLAELRARAAAGGRGRTGS